jgi:CRISPR-associated protein (TIGR02710 family)
MSKILLVTVGGSPQPILTAVKSLKPDRIIFICSSGSRGSESQIIGKGKPCVIRRGGEIIEELPNIPTQLNLGDKFQPSRDLILIDDPDDLSETYRRISEKIKSLQQENSESELITVDYTGGTKTMSAALAIAALDYQLNLQLTTNATRKNLIAVERGERVTRASVASLKLERLVEQSIPPLLKEYNYPAAIIELETFLQETELPSQDKKRVEELRDYCIGFEQWDRFNHAGAWGYLESYLSNPKLQDHILFLKRVMASREEFAPAVNDDFQAPVKTKCHGYEIVEDLVLNAQRRAKLARYDDAVARLYRALELLEQVRWWQQYEIKTGDVNWEKLPISVRPQSENMSTEPDKKQLALMESYDLLSRMDQEPLGQLFLEYKGRIFDQLQIRNFSIFAHGLKPVSEQDYQNFANVIIPFIEKSLTAIIPVKSQKERIQFPEKLTLSSS